MICVGIDPGVEGGLCAVRYPQTFHDAMPMPQLSDGKKKHVDAYALSVFLRGVDFIVLERVHSMPGQGVSSSFQFGRQFGGVEAACVRSGVPLLRVTPAVWKKHHGLIKAPKDAARDLAISTVGEGIRPHLKTKKSVGIAEAALMAVWGLRERA